MNNEAVKKMEAFASIFFGTHELINKHARFAE